MTPNEIDEITKTLRHASFYMDGLWHDLSDARRVITKLLVVIDMAQAKSGSFGNLTTRLKEEAITFLERTKP